MDPSPESSFATFSLYNSRMSEPARTLPEKPITPLKTSTTVSNDDKMPCDRCGAEMYRMHAVWRCPACGFKTDCCGW
jgi:rubrerythrin